MTSFTADVVEGLNIEARCLICVELDVSGAWLRCSCFAKRSATRLLSKARMSFMMRRLVIVLEPGWATGKAPWVRRLRFVDDGCPLCRLGT